MIYSHSSISKHSFQYTNPVKLDICTISIIFKRSYAQFSATNVVKLTIILQHTYFAILSFFENVFKIIFKLVLN